MGNMDSAHPLVEVNVSFKFERNPSISKGVIERTRIGDGPTDGPTDLPTDATKRIQYSPPNILWWGYNKLHALILINLQHFLVVLSCSKHAKVFLCTSN